MSSDVNSQPTWDELRYRVYWLPVATAALCSSRPAVRAPISSLVSKCLVWCDVNEREFFAITDEMTAAWGVTIQAVQERASANNMALLADKRVSIERWAGAPVALLPVQGVLKSAALLAGNLREFVGPTLPWPLHALMPAGDFVLLFSQQQPNLIDAVSEVVLREFQAANSRYADAADAAPLRNNLAHGGISPELFVIDDVGLRAVGRFVADDPAKA